MIKINFFGTHEFAKTILEALIKDSNFEVGTVFTMPDRPVGRKQVLQPSSVKLLAEEHGFKIEQPTSLKEYAIPSASVSLNIVCDYGIIVPKNILDNPKYGSINIHPSLLPLYRGATPLQSALVNGEKKTGITIMLMDEKMDRGPILAQKEYKIDVDDTYLELRNKLALEAQNLTILTCLDWVNGKIKPTTQDDSEATFCKEFNRVDGKIDWNKNAEDLYNQYRGMTPWPGVFTFLNGKRLKLIKLSLPKKILNQVQSLPSTRLGDDKVGQIKIKEQKVFVYCGDVKLIEILELQLEGKKPLDAKTFLNGNKDFKNETLG